MKAAIYHQFQKPLSIEKLPDPRPTRDGVVLQVEATGLCRSDWHGWMSHDSSISLSHVPGHEIAGKIVAVGEDVKNWTIGDRVTLPFVCGCGACSQCISGNHQVCDNQFQPGFTHWGSFAEYVGIHYADINLVRIPDNIESVTAASLGCRFATSFHAVVQQGKVMGGEWVAIHGCGGVGLSAIMIANALGARVIAIDIDDAKLAFAQSLGAVAGINAINTENTVEAIRDISGGGVHLSIDGLGSQDTCFNSIAGLRKRGKHVQVGLMLAGDKHPKIPMDQVIAHELQIFGSHGIQAHHYPQLLSMIEAGKLSPEKLIGKTISLEESLTELTDMNSFQQIGVTVINEF